MKTKNIILSLIGISMSFMSNIYSAPLKINELLKNEVFSSIYCRSIEELEASDHSSLVKFNIKINFLGQGNIYGVKGENLNGALCGENQHISTTTETTTECVSKDSAGNCTQWETCKVDVSKCNGATGTYTATSETYDCVKSGGSGSAEFQAACY
jgi:hypothetical protein